jgi:hypothetical protein
MIKNIYFYSSTENYDPDWAYHEYICVAEGFEKLGIKCFGNRNMYKESVDKEYLIRYEEDFNLVDADIIFFHFSLYTTGIDKEQSKKIIKDLRKQNKKAVFIFIDAADGVHTPGYYAAPFCNIVLKCHYNLKYSYPDNCIPWQFGFNSRILNAVNPLEYSKRDNSILVNFRPQHQLRHIVNELIKPVISPYFKWDTTTDTPKNMNENDMFLYKQARGRHIPAYYSRLSRSKICACYGGVFAIPYGNHDKYSAKIARIMNKIIPLFEYDRVRQWDSWRLWEAWVAGCTVFHIDFDRYGCKLPVMPQNGKHYVGIDIKNLSSLQEFIINENRLEEIAANGREFAISNYSPEKIAERLLGMIC